MPRKCLPVTVLLPAEHLLTILTDSASTDPLDGLNKPIQREHLNVYRHTFDGAVHVRTKDLCVEHSCYRFTHICSTHTELGRPPHRLEARLHHPDRPVRPFEGDDQALASELAWCETDRDTRRAGHSRLGGGLPTVPRAAQEVGERGPPSAAHHRAWSFYSTFLATFLQKLRADRHRVQTGHSSVDDPDGTLVLDKLHEQVADSKFDDVRDDIFAIRAPPSGASSRGQLSMKTSKC